MSVATSRTAPSAQLPRAVSRAASSAMTSAYDRICALWKAGWISRGR